MATVELEWVDDRRLKLRSGVDDYLAEHVPEEINGVRVNDPGWRLYHFVYQGHWRGQPMHHTEWPHRIYDIVAATDHDLAERFAAVMHDMHAAVLELEEADDATD